MQYERDELLQRCAQQSDHETSAHLNIYQSQRDEALVAELRTALLIAETRVSDQSAHIESLVAECATTATTLQSLRIEESNARDAAAAAAASVVAAQNASRSASETATASSNIES